MASWQAHKAVNTAGVEPRVTLMIQQLQTFILSASRLWMDRVTSPSDNVAKIETEVTRVDSVLTTI
jgi:hypothetical protein